MKKVLKIALIVVPLVVIIGLVVFYFSLNAIVKGAAETMVPKITGTPFSVGKVSLSMFSGAGELTDVTVGNPAGFQTANAFSLGTVRVSLKPLSVFSNRIVIREIYIDSPRVTYELGLSGSNIGQIQENVKKFTATEEKKPEAEKEGKKVQIDDFLMKNCQMAVSATGLQGRTLGATLPDIHLKDIGKETGGASVGQVAEQLFTPLFDSILAAASPLRQSLEGQLKSLGGKAGGALESGAEGVKKGLKGIGDLFDKDK